MTKNNGQPNRPPRALRDKISRLKQDRRGVSAVEFALILPLMLGTYLGVVEISNGLLVSRSTTNVASSVADLVGQTSSVSTANVNTILAAAEAIISPFATAEMKIHVSSYCKKSDGTVVKDWNQAYQSGTSVMTVSSPEITSLLINNGDSLIVAEAEYNYTFISPAKNFFNVWWGNGTSGGALDSGPNQTGSFQIKDRFFVRPRNASIVKHTDINSGEPNDTKCT